MGHHPEPPPCAGPRHPLRRQQRAFCSNDRRNTDCVGGQCSHHGRDVPMVATEDPDTLSLQDTNQCQRIRIDLLCRGSGKGSPAPDSPLAPRLVVVCVAGRRVLRGAVADACPRYAPGSVGPGRSLMANICTLPGNGRRMQHARKRATTRRRLVKRLRMMTRLREQRSHTLQWIYLSLR